MEVLKTLYKIIFVLELYCHLLRSECKPIDGHIRKYIRKYEMLDYNPNLVNEKHEKNRRYADYVLNIKLTAFGRDLILELRKDYQEFTDDYVIELNNGSVLEDDLSFLYSGVVKGIPGSYCYGSVIQGIYQGSIHLPDEIFYVEKNNRLLPEIPVFHSTIYRVSDITFDQLSMLSPEEQEDIQVPTKESYQLKMPESYHRNKRTPKMRGKRNTCTLYLVSDWLLWDHVLERSGGDAVVARQEIVATLYAHVHTVNRIFLRTTFQTYDGSLTYQDVQLSIKKIKVYVTKSSCDFPLCKAMGREQLLHLFAMTKFDEFCLAYAFTYRDFSEGVLGMAFKAFPKGASGGICEKYKLFRRNEWKSLNTGVLSLANYGTEIPPRLSHLSFAHLIGHSFGSPLDSDDDCVLDGSNSSDGNADNYIMFSGVISGDHPHNDKFSPCSKDMIARVLNSSHKDCLIENKPICGNHVIEEGEECDCGYQDDCEEVCCNPVTCKLNIGDGNICSPSQGHCCSNTCQYIHAGHVCKDATDCTLTSRCTGLAADCTTVNKEDGSYCANLTATCNNGECDGSLCKRIGWTQCFLTDAKRSPAEQCKLACEKNGTCIASYDTEVDRYPDYKQMLEETTGQLPAHGIWLQPGAPCNNYLGYCDLYAVCRTKGNDDVLERDDFY